MYPIGILHGRWFRYMVAGVQVPVVMSPRRLVLVLEKNIQCTKIHADVVTHYRTPLIVVSAQPLHWLERTPAMSEIRARMLFGSVKSAPAGTSNSTRQTAG